MLRMFDSVQPRVQNRCVIRDYHVDVFRMDKNSLEMWLMFLWFLEALVVHPYSPKQELQRLQSIEFGTCGHCGRQDFSRFQWLSYRSCHPDDKIPSERPFLRSVAPKRPKPGSKSLLVYRPTHFKRARHEEKQGPKPHNANPLGCEVRFPARIFLLQSCQTAAETIQALSKSRAQWNPRLRESLRP